MTHGRGRSVKICKRCGQEKSLEEFYRAKRCILGVRPECKRCTLNAQAAHYHANPRPAIEKAAAYRRANPERNRVYQRAYYNRHREAIQTKAKVWERNWRIANPERRRANEGKRRAAKRQTATGPVDYLAVLRAYGRVCHLCGGAIEVDDLEFDHVIPLSKGGTHTENNSLPAHRARNRRKYNKTAE